MGRAKTPTPSAAELRAKYGAYMDAFDIMDAAELHVAAPSSAFNGAARRMKGFPPSARRKNGRRSWRSEDVAAALGAWAAAHEKKTEPEQPQEAAEPEEYVPAPDTRCRSCYYGTQAGGLYACVYIVETGERRPCKAGPDCTVYKEDKRKKECTDAIF